MLLTEVEGGPLSYGSPTARSHDWGAAPAKTFSMFSVMPPELAKK